MSTVTQVDDDLVARLRQGDAAAFDDLARRHHTWLVRTCRPLLNGDHHAAEDVAQECLVRLHAAVVRDERPLAVRAWLSVVARNLCIDQLRRKAATPVDELPDVAHLDADPFEVDPALASAWGRLQARQREVLHHRELTGLRYDEIATVMGTSVSAVETLLFRARAALRREYQRAGGRMLGCGALLFSLDRLAGAGTPDGPATSTAASHVAGCPACQRALFDTERLSVLLRTGELLPDPTRLASVKQTLSSWLHRLGDLLMHPGAHLIATAEPLNCIAAAVAVTLTPAVADVAQRVPARSAPATTSISAPAVHAPSAAPAPAPSPAALPVGAVTTPAPVASASPAVSPSARQEHQWWAWPTPSPRPSSSDEGPDRGWTSPLSLLLFLSPGPSHDHASDGEPRPAPSPRAS